MAAQPILAALRRLGRRPLALASLATVVVMVSGVVAVVRLASTPAATKIRIVYQQTATPVPGPTQTVTRTITKQVLVTPSASARRQPTPATQLRCSSPQLTLDVTSNKAHYAQGEVIRLTATLRRQDPPNSEYQHFDPRPCFVDPGGFTVYLTDDAHRAVYPYSRPFFGVYPEYYPYTAAQFPLARGGSHTVTYTWDGTTTYPGNRSHGPAYAGDYHAVAEWMYPYAGSDEITFTLDGPPAP